MFAESLADARWSVEPSQPPILFEDTTNRRLVSMGLPGPIKVSHWSLLYIVLVVIAGRMMAA